MRFEPLPLFSFAVRRNCYIRPICLRGIWRTRRAANPGGCWHGACALGRPISLRYPLPRAIKHSPSASTQHESVSGRAGRPDVAVRNRRIRRSIDSPGRRSDLELGNGSVPLAGGGGAIAALRVGAIGAASIAARSPARTRSARSTSSRSTWVRVGTVGATTSRAVSYSWLARRPQPGWNTSSGRQIAGAGRNSRAAGPTAGGATSECRPPKRFNLPITDFPNHPLCSASLQPWRDRGMR